MLSFFLLAALMAAMIDAHSHASPLAALPRVRRVTLQPGLSLTAAPAALDGVGGIVTVTWSGLSFPDPADWVGLWCNGNPSTPPSPISQAPVKYQVVNISSTWWKGSGSIDMFVPNMRADCAFFLLNGGAQYPLVVGASNVVALTQPNYPAGVRLAVVDSSHMQVMWTTQASDDAVLALGTAPDAYSEVMPATSATFRQEDMCDSPAADNGWVDPGVLNRVVFPVEPLTRYYYTVSGPPATSQEYSFVSPPPPGLLADAAAPLMFLAFGDMGNADYFGNLQHSWDYNNRGEINALNTTRRMIAELESATPPSLVLHIGDLSYAVGYEAEWDQFLTQISPLASAVPWMTAIGNHEFGTASSFVPSSDSGGECGVPYAQYFRMPAPADTGRPDTPWYTFTHGPVAFVVMSTEHNFTTGTAQHAWIAGALAAVDRAVTPWLVFAGHRPMYIDSTWNSSMYSDQAIAVARGISFGARWHGGNSLAVVQAVMRAHLEPLLVSARVDVALWGHHHTFQRTCPVVAEACTTDGPVHLVIGMAGYDLTHNLMDPMPSYFNVATDQFWGYTRFFVDNKSMKIEFVADIDGAVKDTVTLVVKSS